MTAIQTTRRSFITGLVSFVAAPAIVRSGLLMPVKVMEPLYGVGPALDALTVEHILAAKRAFRAAQYDLIGFGAGAVYFENGRVFHVPIGELSR